MVVDLSSEPLFFDLDLDLFNFFFNFLVPPLVIKLDISINGLVRIYSGNDDKKNSIYLLLELKFY